jgi:hypothetical protein
MAQPFPCNCSTPVRSIVLQAVLFHSSVPKSCLGVIQGAKFLTQEELSRQGFINKHILEMIKREQREP